MKTETCEWTERQLLVTAERYAPPPPEARRPLTRARRTTLRPHGTRRRAHPQQVIVDEQKSFEAAGVIQDHRLRAQATFHGPICGFKPSNISTGSASP
ncbi:hypothetical protein EYF80_066989 [Liparis tanakae]|uniref:Uncharacterized protein n=1 Tax=Liparis tanakae TaxID=230148 RepID=A0A4Z2E2L1_9TELE|nr:hypothetical protein EYF80_066989 [Liparis tanakae]